MLKLHMLNIQKLLREFYQNKLGLKYNYTIYFSVFGKNLKTNIHASSEEHAKQLILEKINFIKIEKGEIIESKFYENLKGNVEDNYSKIKSNYDLYKNEVLDEIKNSFKGFKFGKKN